MLFQLVVEVVQVKLVLQEVAQLEEMAVMV
jgi:hypothetical protein